MIIDNAGTYTLRYTATDDCGKTTTVDRELVVAEPIYSWTDGTDEQVLSMIERADRGELNLADYWHVGDERVVHLSAMSAMSPLTDAHDEQDVILVLMNVGGKTLATPTEGGRTECSFIVGQKNSLNNYGRMNSSPTNAGGWDACPRRTWCNTTYYNAIPPTLRPIFKQFKNKTANGGSGATAEIESTDYFALSAEYEVLGSYSLSSGTYEAGLTQFEWYETPANRIKRRNGSTDSWSGRSPVSSSNTAFVSVTTGGITQTLNAANVDGIAPFGVI